LLYNVVASPKRKQSLLDASSSHPAVEVKDVLFCNSSGEGSLLTNGPVESQSGSTASASLFVSSHTPEDEYGSQ
jgi:hypothetical protein